MIKRWKVNDNYSFREKILYVMLGLSITVSAFLLIAGSFANISGIIMGLMAIMFAISVLCMWVIYKYKKVELIACLLVGLVNNIMFPLIFFTTAGLTGGTAILFVFELACIYFLFSGKKLICFTVSTIVSEIITFCVGYYHYEWIKQISIGKSYISNMILIAIVGYAICLFIKYQKDEYNKEAMLAEKRSRELESMSRAQSAFFANMSHEIRTPINTIIGLNEMILREEISDEIAENAINIQNASKMLLVLINDILDLSKLESGKMEIVPVQYETGAMFSDLVNIIWIRAHDKGLEFKIDIAEDIPSMLYGDEVRLKQVLTNILTNAVKYTEKGSVTLSAKSERVDNNKVLLHISVEDTGMGIKKESIRDLFSSFKRVDEEKNRNIEGTGLGLSISKQLIEMMGGEIAIDSIYTKGSIFTVTVEQGIVDNIPIGSVDFMVRKKLFNRAKYHQSFEAPDVKVLIVDDNEMNLMVAKKLLRSTKVQIDTARSGNECLEKTKTNVYHVIFMDHMMPEMDGEETLKQLKIQDNGHCQNVPVIALTANVMSNAEKVYMEKGFDGYLAKPINGALFEATLLKYIPEELIEYNEHEIENTDVNNTIKMVSQKKKKKIAITTDCLCDLPSALLEQFDIKTMYYYVNTDEGRFCDTKEISSDNLLKYMEHPGNSAHSSPAVYEEYESFMASALSEADKIIHISMASKSSDGFHRASVAAKSFDNVTVIDSGHVSCGMGIMVLCAAKMADEGKSVEEICSRLSKLQNSISTSFVLHKADNMYRSRLISKRVKNICDVLNVHPVLFLNQNMIKLKGIELGSTQKVYKKYIHKQLKNKKKIDNRILFIPHSGCTVRQVEEIKEEVNKYMEFENVIVQKTSATISANCGIGAFGLIFMKK